MFSFYHLLYHNILNQYSYTPRETFPPGIVYSNNLGHQIVFHPELYDNTNPNIYLYTNSLKLYLQHQFDRMRFIPYWSNIWMWPPREWNDTSLAFDSTYVISCGMRKFKNSYNFNEIEILKQHFPKIILNLSHFAAKETFKIGWLDKSNLIEIVDTNVYNIGYTHNFIPNDSTNYWNCFGCFSTSNYNNFSLYYFNHTDISDLFNSIYTMLSIDPIEIVFDDTLVKAHINFPYDKFLSLYKISVSQLTNSEIDIFKDCYSSSDIINTVKDLM